MIQDCTASDEKGGAVNVASGKSMTFEGNVTIWGNTGTGSLATQQKNVVLEQNNNTTINTTAAGLGSSAHIGVYVTGAMGASPETPYKEHGAAGRPFGTYVTNTDNLDKFENDRNGLKGIGKSVTAGTLIYWGQPPVVINVKGNTAGDPALTGATFTLTNSSNVKVWQGTSDEDGKLTIPWDANEAAVTEDGGCAIFALGSAYTLTQTAAVDGYVKPAGTWTLTGGNDQTTCSTTASTGSTNRTQEITRDSTDLYSFTVKDDVEPKVTYEANGGAFPGDTDPALTDKDDTVDFTNTETSHRYTVKGAAAETD